MDYTIDNFIMLRTLGTLLLLALSMGILWSLNHKSEVRACEGPLTYSVGTFDRRFGLEYEEFLEILSEAEAVWESPQRELAYEGREIFKYDAEEAELPVNLVYDYRQEVTQNLSEIESEVRETEETYRSLEERYRRMKDSHESQQESFDSALSSLHERNARYEARVDEWNAGPRNSESEFNALEEERLAINSEVERLRDAEDALNRDAREINSLVDRMNRLARNLNLNVSEYNTIGASRGETFEGGVYEIDEEGERINIYEFASRDDLVRILAHELGHALGIEHIDDPEAIMYRQNTSEADMATVSDLAALEELCGVN